MGGRGRQTGDLRRLRAGQDCHAARMVPPDSRAQGRARWQIDAHGYWRSSGDRLLTKKEVLSFPVSDLQRVLNSDYFRDGVGYLKAEEMKKEEPSLFDFLDDVG